MDFATFLLVVVAGLALGVFFYGGLWWTLQRLAHSRHPASLALLSFVLRLSLSCVGLALLMQDQLWRLFAAFAGFLCVRVFMVRQFQSAPEPHAPAIQPPRCTP